MEDGLTFPIYIGEYLDYTYPSIAKRFGLVPYHKFNGFEDKFFNEVFSAGITLYRLIHSAKARSVN